MTQANLFDAAVGEPERSAPADLPATMRALATRLAITRPLAMFDIESTGPLPAHDRIIELAVAVVTPAGRTTIHRWLVNPGVPIPSEASAVHGITDADVAACPRFAAIAPEVAGVFAGVDVAGFNIARFDVTLLVAEFARLGAPAPFAQTTRVLDAYRIFVRREPRDLTAAVRFYCPDAAGFEAHHATADVEATARVLLGQLDKYAGDLPADVDGLHAFCDARDPSWIDETGKIIWRDGEARIGFGKHAGRALRELAANEPGFLRWMLARDFAPDVLAIVSGALDGRFPGRPCGLVAV